MQYWGSSRICSRCGRTSLVSALPSSSRSTYEYTSQLCNLFTFFVKLSLLRALIIEVKVAFTPADMYVKDQAHGSPGSLDGSPCSLNDSCWNGTIFYCSTISHSGTVSLVLLFMLIWNGVNSRQNCQSTWSALALSRRSHSHLTVRGWEHPVCRCVVNIQVEYPRTQNISKRNEYILIADNFSLSSSVTLCRISVRKEMH